VRCRRVAQASPRDLKPAQALPTASRILKPARGGKNPEQHLTKEQQKACLDSAAAELIREIKHKGLLS
jgi:hypothetical protein